jgi:hypothetical protein
MTVTVADIIIKYGPGFSTSFSLNNAAAGGSPYYCKGHDLFGGADNEVILAESVISYPQQVRTRAKERVFSILVTIIEEPWSKEFNTALNNLKRVVYRTNPKEAIRISVYRDNLGYMYLEGYLDGLKETADSNDFLLKFTAPNPIFTLDAAVSSIVVTQPGSGSYIDASLSGYLGTAVAEPTLTLEVVAGSSLWQYYRTVTFHNNSSNALTNYPVCLQLGNIASWVSGGKVRADLGDIRLETTGGAPKPIYVRNPGGAYTNVRVWWVVYNLAAGASVSLRLKYGNALATAETELDEGKPMIDMAQSDNTTWYYADMRPESRLPQNRSVQFVNHAAIGNNIQAINYEHPAFSASVEAGTVNAAGALVPYTGPTSGYSGLELTFPIRLIQLDMQYRYRTASSKTPFVLRSRRSNNRWYDDLVTTLNTGQRTTLSRAAITGTNAVYVYSNSYLSVGNTIDILLDSGSYHAATISAIANTGVDWRLTFGPVLPSNAAVGNEVTQYPSGALTSYTHTWAANAYPTGIACCLRGDAPTQNSGDWYYGGAEWVQVYFVPAEQISTVIGAEVAVIHDITGTLTNSYTGESLAVHCILTAIGDKLTINCEQRTCTYTPSGGSPINRMDSLTFNPAAIGRYWVHIEPTSSAQALTFSGTNLYNIRVTITYPTKYY